MVTEAAAMSPLERSPHSPFGKQRLPLAGSEHTYECVCMRAPVCHCPSCHVLLQVHSLLLAWSLGLRLLALQTACYSVHLPHSGPTGPPRSGSPPFVRIYKSLRMSVTCTPTGPLAGFVFFSLRAWEKESAAGWEGELLPFSLSLAICCLLRQACLERVCIKWMQAAIP